jgi:hypothetical protein
LAFLGTEEGADGNSHHPPVTAYAIINEKHGVKLVGYNGQKASFSKGTINVKQVGHAILHLKEFDEQCGCSRVGGLVGWVGG